jgi:hypothetical protein
MSGMSKSIIRIICIALVFIAYACSEKGFVDEKKTDDGPLDKRIIRIVFNLSGDDIGAPEQRAVLNEIITTIRNRDTGEVLSSGFGRGNMEITIKIKGEKSLKDIQGIILATYPEADYRITKPLPPVS